MAHQLRGEGHGAVLALYRHLGWTQAADDIEAAIEKTIGDGIVTYDFARLMDDATEVKASEFAQAIVERL